MDIGDHLALSPESYPPERRPTFHTSSSPSPRDMCVLCGCLFRPTPSLYPISLALHKQAETGTCWAMKVSRSRPGRLPNWGSGPTVLSVLTFPKQPWLHHGSPEVSQSTLGHEMPEAFPGEL